MDVFGGGGGAPGCVCLAGPRMRVAGTVLASTTSSNYPLVPFASFLRPSFIDIEASEDLFLRDISAPRKATATSIWGVNEIQSNIA